ncbi:bis(5'-nucleosyl)-tetraphosphatase (symmetrical) YqeK [Lachnoclostridium sp.]|uniref:bis(5'-nucleosyl)-tetraphosphatase (symmetrical) YqeK n=1 Tax=Lachnoclostridium sp. TaxID=2028282 RepID=UPI0028982A24|nr:bis(5'-nucleosyl)-tetraphosphatase (symmetrical) YqeK [Lachnoclostridium sp.]
MNQFVEQIEEQMKQLLPAKRYVHTVGVAYMAASLAMCYGENVEKSMIAGLLHDNAKYIPFEVAFEECKKAGIEVSECERNSPMLLHGKLGAYYARTKYGIHDEEILSSIVYHTTGKPAMTFLEKNIFLSDYIEVHRTQNTKPILDMIRTTAFKNLDLSVYYALDNTLQFLKFNNRLIDRMSFDALEYYKVKINKGK